MDLKDFLEINNLNNQDFKYQILNIKEKSNVILLTLDNKEKLIISIEDYFKYHLNNLKGIDDKTYLILKENEKYLLSLNSCLKKLSNKDFTIKQIKDYLIKSSELNLNDIDKIIQKLIDLKLLDDEKYCLNRFNYLNDLNYSFKQIKIKLSFDGLAKSLIDKYVVYDRNLELKKINFYLNKYQQSIKNKSASLLKQTIMNKLLNQGFNYDLVQEVVADTKLNINDEELLNKEYIRAKNKYNKKYEGYLLKQHLYAYLINKGFNNDDIKKVMED